MLLSSYIVVVSLVLVSLTVDSSRKKKGKTNRKIFRHLCEIQNSHLSKGTCPKRARLVFIFMTKVSARNLRLPLVESSGTRISNRVMYFLNRTPFRNFSPERSVYASSRACMHKPFLYNATPLAYIHIAYRSSRERKRRQGKRQHYVNIR